MDGTTKELYERRSFLKTTAAVASGALAPSYALSMTNVQPKSTTWPAWRNALIGKMGVWHELNTAVGQLPRNYGTRYWSGVGITDRGDLFALNNGGHHSDEGIPGLGNGTYWYNMWADDLGSGGICGTDDPSGIGWQMRHPGTPVNNLQLGGPVCWEPGDGGPDSPIGRYNAARPVRIHYPSSDPINDPQSPPNTHSFYRTVYVDAAHAFDGQERMMRMCCEVVRQAVSSTRGRQVDGFKIATNRWDYQGSDFAPAPGDPAAVWTDRIGGPTGSASSQSTWARDYRTGYIYGAFPGPISQLQRFRPDVPRGKWEQLWTGSSSARASHQGSFIDTRRDRWVWIRHTTTSTGLGTPKIYFVGLSGGTRQAISIPHPAFDRVTNDYAGQTYARDLDLYFILIATTLGTGFYHDELWSFDPDTGIPTLEAVLPDRTPTGPCGGFGYIDALGGILLVRDPFPPYSQKMRFFPTRDAP